MNPKVLIIDNAIMDVLAAENSLRAQGFDAVHLTTGHGVIPKLEYEAPDVVLLNVSMERLSLHELLERLGEEPFADRVAVILFSDMEATALHQICVEHNLHAYYSKSEGVDGVGEFVRQLFD